MRQPIPELFLVGLCASLWGACGSSHDATEVTELRVPEAPSAESVPEVRTASSARHALLPEPPAPERSGRAATAEELAHARTLFAEGVGAFERGDAVRARTLFLQAYGIAPKPQVLVNVAACEIRLGDVSAACAHLAQAWDEGPASARPAILGRFQGQCPGLAQRP